MTERIEEKKPGAELEPVQASRPPKPEEDLWFQYLENLPFTSDGYLTTFADKLIGICTALIAAYVAALRFIGHGLEWYLMIPPGILFLGLLLAVLSIYPHRRQEDYTTIAAIQARYMRGLNRRWILVTISMLSFLVGLVSGVVMLLNF